MKAAAKKTKQRLDLFLVEQGQARSREQARRLIMAGKVLVNGQRVDKAGTLVASTAKVDLQEELPYASRGGYKLAAALDAFLLDPRGCVAVDVGASTGGFTDVLLQRGAGRVYAVDVGYGQLAWKLRTDARVVVMEQMNIRNVSDLPEPVQLATIDVSFIGLELVLPVVASLLSRDALGIVALIKPQFEAGRQQVGKGGVVRDPAVHEAVLRRVLAWSAAEDLAPQGLILSPITGPAGNIEFLVHLKRGAALPQPIETLVSAALAQTRKRAAPLEATAS